QPPASLQAQAPPAMLRRRRRFATQALHSDQSRPAQALEEATTARLEPALHRLAVQNLQEHSMRSALVQSAPHPPPPAGGRSHPPPTAQADRRQPTGLSAPRLAGSPVDRAGQPSPGP